MRCSASDSEAVHRWSGTSQGGVCNEDAQVGLPDLRIFECRTRLDPRSVSAAHHMLRSARDTSDLAPMGLDAAMTDVVAGILHSFERGNRLVLMPETARRLRLVAR